MKRSYLLSVATALIFIIFVGTPLFYLKQSVYPHIFPKTLFFQLVVEVLFVVWLALAISDARYRPKRTPLLLSGAVFLGVLTITSLFGADFHRSFWSTYERMLGIFTVLHLAAFALVLSSLYREIPWKKILYASLATAAFVSILALIQKKIPHLLLDEPVDRPGATFGNPTFLAGYLTFNILIGWYLLLDTFTQRKHVHTSMRRDTPVSLALERVSFLAGVLLCALAFFFTETRGDIVGLAIGFFVLLALFSFRPPEALGVLSSRRLYAGVLLFLFLLGSLFWFTRQNSFWENVPGLSRFRDVSFSVSESNLSLLPRLIAIKAAWRGFLDRPLAGFGWENFNVAYNTYYDPRALELSYQETRFDKPHNFVLEDLVSGGVFLLLARLALFGAFLWQAFKVKSLFGRFAVATGVGFIVRDIFIFDTIGPAIMLYAFFGFIDGDYRDRLAGAGHSGEGDNRSPDNQRGAADAFSPYLFMLIGAGFVAAYLLNVPSMKAAYYEFYGFKRFHQDPTRAIAEFDRALAQRSPYRWNFARDFAAATSEAYFYNPGAVKKEDAIRAISEMEQVAREHPQDAYNHYALVDMYNQISDIDPDAFLSKAERESRIALELSPNRQEVLFSMAKTRSLQGDYAGALAILKKALDLAPNVADSHFYYGLLLSANKEYEAGYLELKKAIVLGKHWKNFYEPRVVADDFVDAGHIDEAVDLYKVAVAMSPDDLDETLYHLLSLGEEKLNAGQGGDVASRKSLDGAIELLSAALRVDPGNLVANAEVGAAYYFKGDFDSARRYLLEAVALPDFPQSPLYATLKPILDELGIKTLPQ